MQTTEGRPMRWATKILKWLGRSLATLLAGGAIYQQIGLTLDAAPPAREMVKVDGRSVHLACSGKGPRTFVLDAGAGAGSFEWYRVGPLLEQAGRVCAFDRAGLGWSDSTDTGYDGLAAEAQLSELVKAGKIPTPFIYVGHSLGANFGEIYRAHHARDISALVLIEPGVPKDLLEDFHGTRAQAMAAADCGAACYAADAATFFGVVRFSALFLGHKSLDERTRSLYQAHLARPSTMTTTIASLNDAPKTAYEDLDVQSFGNTPVITFASSGTREPEGNETPSDVRKWQVGQRAYLVSLSARSSRGGGLVVVPNSTHSSMVLGDSQAKFTARTILAFVSREGL
jgi:pimeloyl-ACP methyl ester carboxylesterase